MKYLFVSAFVLFSSLCQAQIFDKIKNKIENKVNTATDKIINEVTAKEEADAEKSATKGTQRAKRAGGVFDFIAGDSVFLYDNFEKEALGSMAHYWKSSGSGELVQFPGEEGKWLLLNEFTTYKLDTLINLPENFTVEFDILTRADQAKDLQSFSFGLAKDNSVAGYEDNIITKTTLHYWNQEIINSSTDTKVYNTQDYKLANYANAKMHVSMQVNGANLKVYLDENKVLDTDMLDAGAPKYFYFNPSTRFDNHAQLAVGNFRFAM